MRTSNVIGVGVFALIVSIISVGISVDNRNIKTDKAEGRQKHTEQAAQWETDGLPSGGYKLWKAPDTGCIYYMSARIMTPKYDASGKVDGCGR